MLYVESFYLPSFEEESKYLYPTKYPFSIFSKKNFFDIHFSNITILYGGNGCGKSTLLNIMNKCFGLARKSEYYNDDTFDIYTKKCRYVLAFDDNNKERKIPLNSKIIASEDIMNNIINIRKANNQTKDRINELSCEYDEYKYKDVKFKSLNDYDELVKKTTIQKETKTEYIKKRSNILREFSNGETVLRYFDVELENDGLYLLDEPENSLSPRFQIDLLKLIVECSRFCDCQFIIATHSPFLLSIPGAKIYNLDLNPVEVCRWTKLENVRMYYEFFKKNKEEFEDDN